MRLIEPTSSLHQPRLFKRSLNSEWCKFSKRREPMVMKVAAKYPYPRHTGLVTKYVDAMPADKPWPSVLILRNIPNHRPSRWKGTHCEKMELLLSVQMHQVALRSTSGCILSRSNLWCVRTYSYYFVKKDLGLMMGANIRVKQGPDAIFIYNLYQPPFKRAYKARIPRDRPLYFLLFPDDFSAFCSSTAATAPILTDAAN